jgi:hypothetical protein
MSHAAVSPTVGMRPREVGKLLRVGVTKVLGWIKSGKLGAINTASVQCGKPRYVVLPHHLAEFEQRVSAAPPPKPQRRRRIRPVHDYYPDTPDDQEGK